MSLMILAPSSLMLLLSPCILSCASGATHLGLVLVRPHLHNRPEHLVTPSPPIGHVANRLC